jgi:EAL domain-containing protein (putative c-di-GMP-specific phosphodiesterase class I)
LPKEAATLLRLDAGCLREACLEAATWPRPKAFVTAVVGQNGDISPDATAADDWAPAVSVNVSPVQILSGSLVAHVMEALSVSGIPAGMLHLEITEGLFARGRPMAREVLTSLRALGVRISLDDFATGFSCLAYLRSLPIDRIKIDRFFVRSVDGDTKPIVEAILTLARAQGCEVVAEGVETPEQRAILTSMGVDYLQGFLHGQPLAAEEARTWLAEPAQQSEALATKFY